MKAKENNISIGASGVRTSFSFDLIDELERIKISSADWISGEDIALIGLAIERLKAQEHKIEHLETIQKYGHGVCDAHGRHCIGRCMDPKDCGAKPIPADAT